jgi:hypothetical protein
MTTDRCLAAQALVVMNPDSFRPGFDVWLNKNWPIFMAFEHHAIQVWNRGRRRYSARTIMEYIRHHTLLSEEESEFKINDWWTPSCARLYLSLHPDHAGLFELRGLLRYAPVTLSTAGAVAAEVNRQRKVA